MKTKENKAADLTRVRNRFPEVQKNQYTYNGKGDVYENKNYRITGV